MNIEFLSNLFTIASVLMQGIGYTISLFCITIVLAIPIGLLAAFASSSRNAALRGVTRAYVFVMRGTPLMLQLFFFYFGPAFIPGVGRYLLMDRFPAACLTFVLNYAAYFCEIFRGGLLSVDKGQYEAAKVLGMTRLQTTVRIILPQMFKVALPSVTNEAITLVKDTALVTAIGLTDLLHFAKSLANAHVSVVPYAVAAVFYLILTFGLTKLFQYLERKFMF